MKFQVQSSNSLGCCASTRCLPMVVAFCPNGRADGKATQSMEGSYTLSLMQVCADAKALLQRQCQLQLLESSARVHPAAYLYLAMVGSPCCC